MCLPRAPEIETNIHAFFCEAFEETEEVLCIQLYICGGGCSNSPRTREEEENGLSQTAGQEFSTGSEVHICGESGKLNGVD